MEPYTKEGLLRRDAEKNGTIFDNTILRPPSYYEYDLVGIVVHTGSIDSGHYYSFIKERVPLKGTKSQWFEFNDQKVTRFDPNDIPHECFGGYEWIEQYVDGMRTQKEKVKREIGHNAYMLFYQRKHYNDAFTKYVEKEHEKALSKRIKTHKRNLSEDDTSTSKENARRDIMLQSHSGLRRSRSKNEIVINIIDKKLTNNNNYIII